VKGGKKKGRGEGGKRLKGGEGVASPNKN